MRLWTALPRRHPPGWLLELIREQPGGSGGDGDKPTVSVELDGEPIPTGERNKTLTSIAGTLHNGSRTLDELETALLQINAARCVALDGKTPDPLLGSEVRQIARSIHRREPSRATGPDPATLEALNALNNAVLDARSWKGKAGKSDRAVYRALLLLAREFGRKMRHGVKVYVSERQLAELAGVSSRTVWKAKQRLISAGLLSRSSEGSGTKAGALVLRFVSDLPSQVRHSPTGGESPDSALLVRELLRLRWGKRKLGKSCAELLEHLAFYGSADAGDLSEAVNTRRDNVRRILNRLQATNLVECSAGLYTLPADFLARFDAELESSGIKMVERNQRILHDFQKEAYRTRLEERRRRLSPELAAEPGNTPEPFAEPKPPPEDAARGYSEREFRELVSRARERLPELPKEQRVAALCWRLRREDPECFDALRGSLRALGWELSGRGWTSAVYSPATLERALELLEYEAEPVLVAGAA